MFRFFKNIKANWLLVAGRREKLAVKQRPVFWLRYLLGVVFIVLLIMVTLDPAIGMYRGKWLPDIHFIARHTTDVIKSYWFSIPAGLILFAGFMINWQNLSNRMRVRLANWMALSAFLILSSQIAGLIVTFLKQVFGRPRPKYFETFGAFENFPFSFDASFASFPSGHSTTAGVLFACIALIWPRYLVPCLIAGVYFGFTRIIVGAHYPSDVIAGLSFGAWYAYFSAVFFGRRGFIFTFNAAGMPIRKRSFSLS